MRLLTGYAIAGLIAAILPGCKIGNPVGAHPDTGITIQALTATPTIVPAGSTSLITCKATSGNGRKLQYEWDASGAYGYLSPMDSICIFSSPGCHSGPATVFVTVFDGNGASASDSVNLN